MTSKFRRSLIAQSSTSCRSENYRNLSLQQLKQRQLENSNRLIERCVEVWSNSVHNNGITRTCTHYGESKRKKSGNSGQENLANFVMNLENLPNFGLKAQADPIQCSNPTLITVGKKKKKKLKGEEPFMPQFCTLIKFLCRLNLVPGQWIADQSQDQGQGQGQGQSQGGQVRKRKDFYYYVWLATVVTASFLNFLFVLVRFGQTVAEKDLAESGRARANLGAIIGLWSDMMFRSFVSAANINFSTHVNLYFTIANQLLRLRKNPQIPEFRKDFSTAKIMGLIFYLRMAQLIWTGVAKATRPQFVYSLVPPGYRNVVTFTIYVVFQCYTSFSALLLLLFASITIIMLDSIRTLLLLTNDDNNKPSDVQRPPPLKTYKELQILSILYKSATLLVIPYLRMYTLVVSTTCAYGCIRFYDDLDLRIYMTMPLSLTTLMAFSYQFYGKAGKIPKTSNKAARELLCGLSSSPGKGSCEKNVNLKTVKENRLYLKSIKDIRVCNIGVRVFPNIVRFVVVGTVRLLILSSRNGA